MADPTVKGKLLAELEEIAAAIETEEAKQVERRARRNRLLYEAASRKDTTITEAAAAGKVTHSYATRALRTKGHPGSGSAAQAAATKKRQRADARRGTRKGRAAA